MSHDASRRYLSCSTLNGRLYLSYVMALDGTTQLSYWTREDALKVFEFFACERDLSHESPDGPLPDAVATGEEPFLIVGAMAGG